MITRSPESFMVNRRLEVPRSRSKGRLVEGRRIETHLVNLPVKPVAPFQVIGQSPHRKDALDKETRKAQCPPPIGRHFFFAFEFSYLSVLEKPRLADLPRDPTGSGRHWPVWSPSGKF